MASGTTIKLDGRQDFLTHAPIATRAAPFAAGSNRSFQEYGGERPRVGFGSQPGDFFLVQPDAGAGGAAVDLNSVKFERERRFIAGRTTHY
jgi:hypothetical protein